MEPRSQQTSPSRTPYPEGTVGALMENQILAMPQDTKVSAAIRTIRSRRREDFYYAYVTDRESKLVGVLNMRHLLVAEPDDLLESIMIRDVAALSASKPSEAITEVVKRHRYFALPVVDDQGRLAGIISNKTIMTLTASEASDDIQTIFGAGGDEEALSPVGFSIRKRLPWLIINLLTAFLASATVLLFEDKIMQVAALGVLLPIVAGQGGNAGAQSLAVVIRGLALGQVTAGKTRRLIFKEVMGGFVNGLVIALLTFGAIYAWRQDLPLATAIGLAMVINMVVATLFGAIIPVLLKRLGRDPAQASSIILTTFTDCIGFLTFLGLATLLLHLT